MSHAYLTVATYDEWVRAKSRFHTRGWAGEKDVLIDLVKSIGVPEIVQRYIFRANRGEPLPNNIPGDLLREYGGSLHVLADALSAEGHWLGEPLAIAITRPPGASRARRRALAARKFVEAMPE